MTQEPIHVLLVEDNPDHAELMQRVLKRQASVASVTTAARGNECLELLSQNAYSVVLLDYSLPGMDGLSVLKEIRRRGLQVPVVMVTSQGVERVAVEAMQEGASDYIIKAAGYLTTLPMVLSKVLKQHELALENRRLFEEAEHRAQEQTALNDIAMAVSRSLQPDELFQIALDKVVEVTGRERGSIRVKDPVTGEIKLVAHRGISKDAVETIQASRSQGQRMIEVFETGEPVVLHDPDRTLAGPSGLPEWVNSIVWVPLKAGGKVMGVLGSGTRRPIPITPRGIELLKAIGNVIGVALENARLYEETERRRREAEELTRASRILTENLDVSAVGESIVGSVLPLFAAQGAVVWLVQPDSSMIVLAATGLGDLLAPGCVFSPGVGLAGKAIAEGRSVWSIDVLSQDDIGLPDEVRRRLTESGATAVLAVPLHAKGKTIGALAIRDQTGRVFSKDDVALLETFAGQGALTLENARLYEEARRRTEKLEALARLTRLITAATEPKEVFDFITQSAVELLNAKNAYLWLRDEERPGELAIRSRYGAQKAECQRTVIGEGVVGEIVASRKPEFIPDVTKDSRWVRGVKTLGRSFFGIPLLLGEDVVGALSVFTDRPRSFGAEEMDLLKIFADQAAIALENARLFDQVRRSYEELRQAQDHLVRVERLRALGEMAGGVAHDFNNLLAVILGRAQYLQMGLAQLSQEAVKRSLGIIEQSARDGAETVRHLFEFTRGASDVVLGPVNINEVVSEAVAASEPRWKDEAEARGITVTVEMALNATRPALGSAPQLREALLNLIFNAVEAMPDGGRLSLATWEDDDGIRLRIADEGIGMEEAVKGQVFEPFFTTKGPQRSGLGLSMVYGIISHHGGTITIENGEEKGAAFLIHLPLAGTPEISPEPSPVPTVPPSTVLVIDDEETVREALADILGASGHTVVLAASGREGLEWVGRQTFDLICTDLGMPGISGWQVIDAVKVLRPEAPVALITGWGVQVGPDELSAHHADFLLRKPFEISEVLATLAAARLRQNGAEQ